MSNLPIVCLVFALLNFGAADDLIEVNSEDTPKEFSDFLTNYVVGLVALDDFKGTYGVVNFWNLKRQDDSATNMSTFYFDYTVKKTASSGHVQVERLDMQISILVLSIFLLNDAV
jgi:hypothetical protein